MKRILLSILSVLCLCSCSVDYITYAGETAKPVKRTRQIIWEEPKVTTVKVEPVVKVVRPIVQVQQPIVRTTRIIYNTTPIVRTYTPSITYVRRYTPVYQANYRSSRIHVNVHRSRPITGSRLSRPISRYCPRRGWHFTNY